MSGSSPTFNQDAARLARWVDAGGTWRLVASTTSSVTLALLTCDGGEEMDRLISSDPTLVEQISGDGSRGSESGSEPAAEEDP